MEFTQYSCPVCNAPFESGDDVVVCPECGAPHHRSCYESLGHCFYEDRHGKDFSFEQLHAGQPAQPPKKGFEDFDTILCPVCFQKNPKGSKTCSRCGTDLSRENAPDGREKQQDRQQQNARGQGVPPFGFGFGNAAMPNMNDPLAGVDPAEDFGEGVTAGEAAKFTGKNTGYFSLLFQRIKKTGRSRFGFAAFIFGGVYFLYRKMYVVGILFTLAVIAANVLSTCIMMMPEWSACYNDILNFSASDVSSDPSLAYALLGKSLFVYLPLVLNGVRYVLMVVSGLTANRLYYRHTLKTVNRVKSENPDITPEELHRKLEEKGGVNLPIALSFGIAMVVIGYICNFFLMTV